AAGSEGAATSTLLMTGTCGAATSACARAPASTSAAGRSRLEWNGADTGSGRARLAPAALAASQARSTAALCPAMTTWAGALKLTASTTSPWADCAHAARTASSSRPRMAAMAPVPTGTAACMASARMRTRRTASSSASAPAAARAAYSPRLWPAITSGRRPPAARQAANTAMPAVSMAGWVLVVRLSCSAGPWAIRAPRSWPSASPARATTSATAALPAQASSMPTDWDPWPGKTKAIFMMECIDLNTESMRITRPRGAAPGTASPALHAHQDRTPGEAAPDALHQHQLAGLDAAIAARGVERQRHAGRRGVGVRIDGDHHFFGGNTQLARQEIEDADVGLVRDQPVDIGHVDAGLGADVARRPVEHRDGLLEHGLPVHAQERVARDIAIGNVAGGAENAGLRAVGMQMRGQ